MWFSGGFPHARRKKRNIMDKLTLSRILRLCSKRSMVSYILGESWKSKDPLSAVRSMIVLLQDDVWKSMTKFLNPMDSNIGGGHYSTQHDPGIKIDIHVKCVHFEGIETRIHINLSNPSLPPAHTRYQSLVNIGNGLQIPLPYKHLRNTQARLVSRHCQG